MESEPTLQNLHVRVDAGCCFGLQERSLSALRVFSFLPRQASLRTSVRNGLACRVWESTDHGFAGGSPAHAADVHLLEAFVER